MSRLELEHLKEYNWANAVVRARCPKCDSGLDWKLNFPNGDFSLVSLTASCCSYWWKLRPGLGWVESNYKLYLEAKDE